MDYISQLPRDVLALIIRKVPKGTRVEVLQTCQRVLETALTKVWKPHTHGGEGLIEACKQNNVRYFIRWTTAPGTFATKTVRTNAFEAALEGKAVEAALFFIRELLLSKSVSNLKNFCKTIGTGTCIRMGKILLASSRDDMVNWIALFYELEDNIICRILDRNDCGCSSFFHCLCRIVPSRKWVDDIKRNPECVTILLKRYLIGTGGQHNFKLLIEMAINADQTDLLECFLNLVDFIQPHVVLDFVRKEAPCIDRIVQKKSALEWRQIQERNVQLMIDSGKLRLSHAQKHDLNFYLHRKE